MHPAAAVLDVDPIPWCRPGAPTDAVAGFEEEGVEAGAGRFAGGCHAGESTADDDHVVHVGTFG